MPAIVAAGGVLWRRDGGRLLLAVVHRPRYDDWTFPKGKLRAGETPLVAGIREVAEETGLRPQAGRRLPRTHYVSADGPKSVDYWIMQGRPMQGEGEFVANGEVDVLEWLRPDEVMHRLSYADDAVLAREAVSLVPAPVTLLLVRHARAGDRADWQGPDEARPLDAVGIAQAAALAQVLPAFGPTRVLSAEPLRCLQTVGPLASELGLPVETAPEVGERSYDGKPASGQRLLQQLLQDGAGPIVVCSQGGVLPDVINKLIDGRVRLTGTGPGRLRAKKGSVWALGASAGRVVSADYYPNLLPAEPAG